MNTANRSNIVTKLEDTTLLWIPGAYAGYHTGNAGYIMDELSLRANGKDTAKVFLDEVLGPSGISDLYIGLPSDKYSTMAHMWVEPGVRERNPSRASFSDYLNTEQGIGERISWVSGCGTAAAFAEVAQILAGKGTYNGTTYYSEDAHDLFITPTTSSGETDVVLEKEVVWGLAFMRGDTPFIFGDVTTGHDEAVGHLGGSATVVFADTNSGLSYVYLSNSMLGSYESDERYRRIGNAVYSALQSSAPSNTRPEFSSDPIIKPNAEVDASYTGLTLSGSASDPESDPITYTKVRGNDWLTVASNGVLSGIPGNGDDGENIFIVKVDDGTLADYATLKIKVRKGSPLNSIWMLLLNTW